MTVYMIGIKNSCKSYTEIHSTAPADGVKRLQQPHLVKERCSTVSLIQVKVFYHLKTGLLTWLMTVFIPYFISMSHQNTEMINHGK